MKSFVFLCTVLNLAFAHLAFADVEVHANNCLDGPLYRNLSGRNVVLDANLAKSVFSKGNELLQCRVGGECKIPNNDYTCTLYFAKLNGEDALAMYLALSDTTLESAGIKKAQLAILPAAAGSCKYQNCRVLTYLICTSMSCNVIDQVTGWDG